MSRNTLFIIAAAVIFLAFLYFQFFWNPSPPPLELYSVRYEAGGTPLPSTIVYKDSAGELKTITERLPHTIEFQTAGRFEYQLTIKALQGDVLVKQDSAALNHLEVVAQVYRNDSLIANDKDLNSVSVVGVIEE